jgi:cobalt-zinc-cadmium efflux system outer membrane protein
MVRWVLSTWLLLAVSTAANATVVQQEIDSILDKQEILLADLFRLAELRNPALAAAKATAVANAGRARQAGLYPNPIFTFEVEELATADPDFRKEKVTLEQTFIISGRRNKAVASARASEEAAGHDLNHTRREIYRRIHARWADQIYFHEAGGALADLLDLANQTLQIARVRFEARAAPESHVTKALLEVYELEAGQQRLAQQQADAEAELLALLGDVHVPMHRVRGMFDQSPLTGLDEADIVPPPSLNAATSRLESAQAALREAKAERLPDLGVFASYGRIRPTGDSFIEAGVSIPIPLFNRNQGLVAERTALIAEAEAQVRLVATNFNAKLAAGRSRYKAIRAELRILDEQMLPAARRGLEQAQEGYRVGRLPFLELIDAQRTLSSFRLRNLELSRDLFISEAELSSLAGTGPYALTGD